MFKLIVVACVLASVSAFAPRAFMRASMPLRAEEGQTVQDLNLEEMFEVFEDADKTITDSAVASISSFDARKQIGAGAPFDFFDPLNMSKEIDEDTFKLWQEAETKHSRVAMLAFVGLVMGEVLSGNAPFFNGQITGPAIYQFQQADAIYSNFWFGVIVLISWIEGNTILNNWQSWDESAKNPSGKPAKLAKTAVPGDLGFDPLNLKPKDATAYSAMKTKELNNGRLAMIGVAGIVAQELATGNMIF